MADPNAIGREFLAQAIKELDDSFQKVRHCFDQLDESDMWWGPEAHINSVGTLILHVCGNLRQWIVSGVGGAADLRNRPREFAERGTHTKEQLLDMLDAMLREVREILQGLPPNRLLERRRIQGFDETVLSAIYNSVSHFKGHTMQILLITRMRRGETYRLSWVPANKEQGA
jgi:hypothetical protein